MIGDRRKFLTVLITLDEPASKLEQRELHTQLQAQIDQVNASLARVEQIKKFAVLPRPFGIETGELTPTLKIKRKVVAQKYAVEIEAMYTEASE